MLAVRGWGPRYQANRLRPYLPLPSALCVLCRDARYLRHQKKKYTIKSYDRRVYISRRKFALLKKLQKNILSWTHEYTYIAPCYLWLEIFIRLTLNVHISQYINVFDVIQIGGDSLFKELSNDRPGHMPNSTEKRESYDGFTKNWRNCFVSGRSGGFRPTRSGGAPVCALHAFFGIFSFLSYLLGFLGGSLWL